MRIIFFLSVSGAVVLGFVGGVYFEGNREVAEDLEASQGARAEKIAKFEATVENLEAQLAEANLALSRQMAEETSGGGVRAGISGEDSGQVQDAEMAVRAALSSQTFTDRDGRELVATILAVRRDGFQIRRQADNAEFALPVSLLSPKDQAFHAYLYEREGDVGQRRSAAKSPDDDFWKALFSD